MEEVLEVGDVSSLSRGGNISGNISPESEQGKLREEEMKPTSPPPSRSSTPTSKVKTYAEVVKSPDKLLEERVLMLEKQVQVLSKECTNLKNQLIFDIGSPTNPTTLKSDKLTPELIAIGSTLHLWDFGLLNNNIDIERWNNPFGYHAEIGNFFLYSSNVIIDKVQQLPRKNGFDRTIFPTNIMFPSPKLREIGVNSMKNYTEAFGIKNLPLHYSLTKHPILRHQIKAISVILQEMKREGIIKRFSLNNFMAVNTNEEKVAPIFSFQTANMDKLSSYSICPSNEFFFLGNIIPTSDTKFTSEEFILLKGIIRSSLTEENIPEKVYDIYNIPDDPSILDFMVTKPRNKGYKARNQRYRYVKPSVSSNNISQSTPTTKPLPKKACGTLLNYIQTSLCLDQEDFMPTIPNLSIPPPSSSSENSTNISPNTSPNLPKEIEIHEKTYQTL